MNWCKYWPNLRLGDKIVISLALIFSLGGIFIPYLGPHFRLSQEKDWVVVITIAGQEKGRFSRNSLPNEGHVVEVEGPIGRHRIKMTPEGVRVFAPSADPLKICEKTGWIKKPGPVIVCIPNRLVVRLVSNLSLEIDGLSE